MHNNRRNNNRRFNNNKGHNQNKRRFGGGGGGSSSNFDDESANISIQQRKNFANKQDQYLQKAKDALRNGDRIEAESFYQHADHCFRMMNLGLTGGSRFDPVRGHIHNPNQQQNYNNEGGEQNGDNNHNHQQSDNNEGNATNNGGDIASLPFLREPIAEPNPRVIE